MLALIFGLILIPFLVFFWLVGNRSFVPAVVASSNGAHYGINLPKGFSPAHFNDTLPEMSLQYENKDRDLHVLVIDDSKAKIISFGLDYDLETYMKIATRILDQDGVYANKSLVINGNKAIQTEIKVNQKTKKKIYLLTCIETTKYFYQLLVWSGEEKYDSNKADMEMIVNSFKEME
ncbi:hypothetical protein BH09BAC5_BH09BAC5_25630 [soil metagenome]